MTAQEAKEYGLVDEVMIPSRLLTPTGVTSTNGKENGR